MPKTIKIELSSAGIQKAIKELEDYKNSIDDKVKELVQRLGDLGMETVHQIMSSVPEKDEAGDYSVSVEPIVNGENMSGVAINLTGNRILFIEFSAGIRYGTSSYPLPSGKGFGMGTYPDGKGHWNDPKGWWYESDDSPTGYIHTYGNRAYMPMYHAEEAIVLQIQEIANEIFGS